MWQKVKCCLIIIISLLIESQVGQRQIRDGMLKSLKDELGFEYILLKSCELNPNLGIETPLINFNKHQNYSIKPLFHRRLLAIVCLDEVDLLALQTLFINLDGMRNTATLVLVENRIDTSSVFAECFRNQMLNVVAIETGDQEYVYSYQAFPRFKLVKRSISEVERFFEPQMKDMGGYPIRSMPDNILPRSVVYMDARNKPQLTGYLATFLNNFARTLNATVKVCWDCLPQNLKEQTLGFEVLQSVRKRQELDIPMSIIHIGSVMYSHNMTNSIVMEISKSQLILPVEPQMDIFLLSIPCVPILNQFYLFLTVYLLSMLLENNQRLEQGLEPTLWCPQQLIDTILRAMLYQTFVLPRRPSRRLIRIYVLILYFGLLTYSIYIAGLEMTLVDPPRQSPITTYQELRSSGVKILMSHAEEQLIRFAAGRRHMIEFSDVYHSVNSSVFQALRRQPNTSYAYPITQTLWPLIQHKFIKQPQAGFRLSKDFVFCNFVPFGIPLPKNSIYEEALNQYILVTHCSGLYRHWFHSTFQSLVYIGRMEVLPYKSPTEFFHILRWRDFYMAWQFYFISTIVSILVFIYEVRKGIAKLCRKLIRF